MPSLSSIPYQEGGDVLPHTGSSLVPENSCVIPEQIVFEKERFVYRFYRLDSGTIASFRKRSSKEQANYKVVQQRMAMHES